MIENNVRTKVRTALKRLGYIVVKITVCSLTGFPDLIVLRGGNVFFIETKTSGKKASPIQSHIHTILTKQGFAVVILDGKDSIDSLLKNLDYGNRDIPTIY